MAIDLSRYHQLVKEASTLRVRGRVTELTGLVVKAAVPGVRIGEVVEIKSRNTRAGLKGEVVGFQGDEVMLMPLGDLAGIGPDAEVIPTGRPLTIKVGDGLLVQSMQDDAKVRQDPDPFWHIACAARS